MDDVSCEVAVDLTANRFRRWFRRVLVTARDTFGWKICAPNAMMAASAGGD